MFTEAQLISFGNFLFKSYGVQVHSSDGKNTPIYLREVCDPDICNWKEAEPTKAWEIATPSTHQIGESVWLQLWHDDIVSKIHAVHFYDGGKVKYDLIVGTSDGGETRLYNVESDFVRKTIPVPNPA